MIGNSIAFLCSTGATGRPNVMTIMPFDRLSDQPYCIGLSLRPQRFTTSLLQAFPRFTLSLPTVHLVRELNYCGIVSGRDEDKVERLGLAMHVPNGFSLPVVSGSTSCAECEVAHTIDLGSHVVLVGRQIAFWEDPRVATGVTADTAPVVAYSGRDWWVLGKRVWSYTSDAAAILRSLRTGGV